MFLCIPPVESVSQLADTIMNEPLLVRVRKLRPSGMKFLAQGLTASQWLSLDLNQIVWVIYASWQPSIPLIHVVPRKCLECKHSSRCCGRCKEHKGGPVLVDSESVGETVFQQAISVLSYVTRAVIETSEKDHGREQLRVWDWASGFSCCSYPGLWRCHSPCDK